MTPLAGLLVLVPRATGQAGHLAKLLQARGAQPVELPVIRIAPPEDPEPLAGAVAALRAGAFDWVVFTSANAVRAVQAIADGSSLRTVRVAAVGPAAVAGLRAWGAEPDLVPAEATGAALAAAFPVVAKAERILLPRADRADHRLPDALRARGYTPVEVVAYRTLTESAVPPEVRHQLEGVHWAACTSPSTVEGLLQVYNGQLPAGLRLAAIGPTTAAAARGRGLVVDAVAAEHTAEGLVMALEAAARRLGPEARGDDRHRRTIDG